MWNPNERRYMSEETPTPTPDPEPEGAIDVDLSGQKQRMVPVSALVAERERVRAAEREKVTKEYEPLKTKADLADRLQADLQTVQPFINKLREKPELMKEETPSELAGITDEEAERFARNYELFNATGVDTHRAKRIIAEQRKEIAKVAREAAQEAIRPLAETTAVDKSRSHFMWAAQQRDQSGQPLVDPQILAQEWSKLPPKLTATQGVAEFVLNSAIGIMQRTGKKPPAAPSYEPVFSEASGGQRSPYQISQMEQKMAKSQGISEKDWTTRAKDYNPGQVNVLGD